MIKKHDTAAAWQCPKALCGAAEARGEVRLLSVNVLLLLLLLGVACQRTPEYKPQATPLVASQPVHRKLIRDESHTYLIHLANAQYTRVHFAQQGVDVDVALHDQAGRKITTLNCHENEPAILSLLSESAADYWLELRALGEGAGSYELTVEESRPASAHERRLVLGERAFLEGELLRAAAQAELSRQALAKYEEAQTYWRGDEERRERAKALKASGEIYHLLGEVAKALACYQQALTLSRAVDARGLESELLSNISSIYVHRGKYQQALDCSTQAIALSRAAGDQRREAQALSSLGEVYYGFGDGRKSLEHHRQALRIWEQLSDRRGRAQTLWAFGYLHSDLGEPQQASAYYSQALAIWRAVNDRRRQAIMLTSMGNLSFIQGETQKGLNLYGEALPVLRTAGDRLREAIILLNTGGAYYRLGDNDKALSYLEQALQIWHAIDNPANEAGTLFVIGLVYRSIGKYQQALSHFERTLVMSQALNDSKYHTNALREMGAIYSSLGNKRKALTYYQKALARHLASGERMGAASTLNEIGKLYYKLNKIAQARNKFSQALALNRIRGDRLAESQTLYNIARIEHNLGRFDRARAHTEATIELAESLRTKLDSQQMRAAYFASARQYYDLYIDILMRLHEQRPDAKFDIAAFEVSEKARARSLLESLHEARTDIRQGVDPALLEQERKLQQQLNTKAEHQARLVAGNQGAAAEALAKEIAQLTAQYDEVKARIRSSSARYAELKQPQPLSLSEIQRRVLADDSLLLEYALGDERSYLWAVTRTELASFVLPGRAEIEDAACRYYGLLTAGQMRPDEGLAQYQARVAQAEAQRGAANATLSRLLLGVIAARLTHKRLLVVADGALQYIPFQALTVPNAGGNDQELLIFGHEVVNEPSASALALLLDETAKRKPAPHAVAVLADPVFEPDDPRLSSVSTAQRTEADKPLELHQTLRDIGVTGGEIPRLFASREEAQAILAVAPWGSAFKATDFEASRATATSRDLSQYRIIHFATHGFLNNEHPELSGIVLSLVDRGGQRQDGFLRLHDIYNLQLPVDLVVLSACNTGLGKDVKGEGLIGLTRGFMYAGAAGVVASLWKVDDEATAALMQRFYEHMLKRGLAPAAALRESQLAMLREKRWRSPHHWAGFVIQGQYAKANGAAPPRHADAKHLLPWGGAAALLSCFLLLARRGRQRRAARLSLK